MHRTPRTPSPLRLVWSNPAEPVGRGPYLNFPGGWPPDDDPDWKDKCVIVDLRRLLATHRPALHAVPPTTPPPSPPPLSRRSASRRR